MAANGSGLFDTLPFDNRVELDSVNVAPFTFPKTSIPAGTDPRQVAADVVKNINSLLEKKDYDGLAALFYSQGGSWRDHLGLSWDFRTLQGPAKVAAYLKENGRGDHLKSVAIDDSVPCRVPQITTLDAVGTTPSVQFFTTFKTNIGSGQGVIRLLHDSSAWKIVSLYTGLRELTGYEEATGFRRPLGASHGSGRNMQTWFEKRTEEQRFVDTDPTVFIIGAGQGGLTSAARLKMLNVSTLVVDREERVGDNWRNRYRQLVLHDPVWFDHLPYMPFPASWPVFTPKDKLADFFEAYVKLLELNVWTKTEVLSLKYDAAKKRYEVVVERTLERGITEKRTFYPKHIIQATGHSGKKNLPDIPGYESFKGRVCHSSEFPGATPQPPNAAEKRRAVVVGSCNSGHDIAQDFYENGYEVTMVQRSTTCVVSSHAIEKIGLGALYSEEVQQHLPVDDADLLNWSNPAAIAKAVAVQNTSKSVAYDAPLLKNLANAGFSLDTGPNGAGLFYKYFQRGGGYYIDVGCSQLIVDGKIKIKSGSGAAKVTDNALVLEDGTSLPADEIVFATGYQNMRTQTRVLFGDALADACHDVWGLDNEGEFRTMWRRSGQPGYWFMGGNLAISRFFGQLLALQIKAQEVGLAPY